MKACPTCKRTYADETLSYCLVDGSILSAPYDPHETLRIPAAQATNPAPTEILTAPQRPSDSKPPLLSTIQSSQPPPLYGDRPQAPLKEKPGGTSRVAIGIVMALVFISVAGVVLSFIWFGQDLASDNPTPKKVPNVNVMPTPTPTATVEAGGWGMRNDHASLNGENLTYYPGTTPEQCKADCDKDMRCKGYTFIRAGAYNPNDSAMCYQASVVTGMVSHACCISAIKK